MIVKKLVAALSKLDETAINLNLRLSSKSQGDLKESMAKLDDASKVFAQLTLAHAV